MSAVTEYVCPSTPSSAITQSLASRVTLEGDIDDYQLVKDSKEEGVFRTHTHTHTHHNSEDVDKLLWTPSKIEKGFGTCSPHKALC